MAEIISMQEFRNRKAEADAPIIEQALKPASAVKFVKFEGGIERFDYSVLMKNAMLHLLRNVLSEVARNGLPRESSLLIRFDMTKSDVRASDRVRERHPKDVTIILDQWWENLVVGDNGFEVTLNFGDVREHLFVPYEAIMFFLDQAVNFGLVFSESGERDAVLAPQPPSVA